MKTTGVANTYDIAMRQFKQQILPPPFPVTTVWSYGPASDPVPDVAPAANSQFNYPAYTIETTSGVPVNVKWRNELVAIDPVTGFPYAPGSGQRSFLPHLFDVDQTLHWANPPAAGCVDNTNRTDCRTLNPAPYLGPVPMITHVHGAHVQAHSDGYPEQWYLPDADNIPAGYATEGSVFDDALGQLPGGNSGQVDFVYSNDQPATTLWYHDHSLGITRLNVYAGPAGFWLVRGGANYSDADVDDGTTGAVADGNLPGPAPVAGQGVAALNTPGDPVRNSIREIPIVIQDRSFREDGSLLYPDSRIDFDNYTGPYVPDSDISPMWNPEAFFNAMVVNGTVWPTLEVAPALYRFRLLNGNDSRFLNLALFEAVGDVLGTEHPFYQIGAEQGFLTEVVEVVTGQTTTYPGGVVTTIPVPREQQALLMGLAERADVLVDFRGLADGIHIRMINTAADSPFGGFDSSDPDADPPAMPATTGQVMEFVVNSTLLGAPTDPGGATPATTPQDLILPSEATAAPLPAPLLGDTRQVSLNEEESGRVCVTVSATGEITVVYVSPTKLDAAAITSICNTYGAVPQAPASALLGTVDLAGPDPLGVPLQWTDKTGASTPVQVNLVNGGTPSINVTENPTLNTVEDWEIYNFTEDAHPIHLHLVRFQVLGRREIGGGPGANGDLQPWETGFKDTVIAYPGEITTVRALFDIAGLYVWHCHILEHEDNEMMRPFVVSP
ncbi:MAG: multicopper oxidase domain-containing protein [Proteobacteria bacterium]|nr:multicopper oxidase domain-containing protein [Pseudomonadota bacterium]MBU1738874.1 multicopper oxidase domain-containing protein [Pseudomonadota bacterium]